MLLKLHKGKELPMLRGSGYILEEDGQTYISAMNGRIELRDNQLIISRLFEFDEITMATGSTARKGVSHDHFRGVWPVLTEASCVPAIRKTADGEDRQRTCGNVRITTIISNKLRGRGNTIFEKSLR